MRFDPASDRILRDPDPALPAGKSATWITTRSLPGRYGYESAGKYKGRAWSDVESDLERDWNSYSYRGKSTWQQVKDAVRDGWDKVTGGR